MPDYRERLRVPHLWWVICGLCVAILGSETLGAILDSRLFGGYKVVTGVAVYALLALICAATLLHWGGAVVSVSGGELRAGATRVPLGATGEVAPLDPNQTRAMRGPRADPAAFLLARPYLRQAVYVEVTGPEARWPYLLIGTRQPGRLAEAITRSRAGLAAHE